MEEGYFLDYFMWETMSVTVNILEYKGFRTSLFSVGRCRVHNKEEMEGKLGAPGINKNNQQSSPLPLEWWCMYHRNRRGVDISPRDSS